MPHKAATHLPLQGPHPTPDLARTGAVLQDARMFVHCQLGTHPSACHEPRCSDWDALLTEELPLYHPPSVIKALHRTYKGEMPKIMVGGGSACAGSSTLTAKR